jgi:hypothetical protein
LIEIITELDLPEGCPLLIDEKKSVNAIYIITFFL